jgi:hypothetical protein
MMAIEILKNTYKILLRNCGGDVVKANNKFTNYLQVRVIEAEQQNDLIFCEILKTEQRKFHGTNGILRNYITGEILQIGLFEIEDIKKFVGERIVELKKRGLNFQQIAEKLNSEGNFTVTGKKWGYQNVRNVYCKKSVLNERDFQNR